MDTPEQAQKLIELAKLKAELSTSFYAIDTYRALIAKIVSPTELLSEEECTQANSKEFAKVVTGMAIASAKVSQWHKDNKKEDIASFLEPAKTIQQVA